MINIEFEYFCFSIIFTDLKTPTNHLSPFIYDKNRLLDVNLKFRHQSCSRDWFDPLPSAQFPKFLIAEINTNGNDPQTLFLSNLSDGWTTGARKLSQLSKARSLQIALSADNSQSAKYKYEVIESGKTVRVILLYKEGKWVFVEKGAALPYENEDYYLRRRKSTRLTNELIVEYLDKEGVNLSTLISQPLSGLLYERLSW